MALPAAFSAFAVSPNANPAELRIQPAATICEKA